MINIFQKVRDLLGIGVSEIQDGPTDVLEGLLVKAEFLESELQKAQSEYDEDSTDDLLEEIKNLTDQIGDNKREITDIESNLLTKAIEVVALLSDDERSKINHNLNIWELAGSVNGEEITNHAIAIVKAVDYVTQQGSDIEKAEGEGSRGGHVIGHTRNGKAIYERGQHYPNFDHHDHLDAADLHAEERNKYPANHSSHDVHDIMVAWHKNKAKEKENYYSGGKPQIAVDYLKRSYFPFAKSEDDGFGYTGHYSNVIVKRIFKDGGKETEKILFLKRAADKAIAPNQYCLPGGHIDEDEHIVQAGQRELKEEAGIDCPYLSVTAKAKCDNGKWAFYLTNMGAVVGDPVLLDGESSNACWMSVDEWMDADLFFDLKEHLAAIEMPTTLGVREIPTINKSDDEYFDLEKGGVGSGVKGHTTPIDHFVSDMIDRKVQLKIVHIKDESRYQQFLKDAKPYIDNKTLIVRRSPIDENEIHISLGPKGQDAILKKADDLEKGQFYGAKTGKGEGARGGRVIGHTKSGKAVYARLTGNDRGYKHFTPQDHHDAARFHSEARTPGEGHGYGTTGSTESFWHGKRQGEHEAEAKKKSGTIEKSEDSDLEKGGEGSKGGHVIGHTRSGKPIYDKYSHGGHKNFTKEDHWDAQDAHIEYASFQDTHTSYGEKTKDFHDKERRKHEYAATYYDEPEKNPYFKKSEEDNILEKGGKRGTEGEIRVWKGRRYQKHGKMWIEVRDPKKNHLAVADVVAHAENTSTPQLKKIASRDDHAHSDAAKREIERRKADKDKAKPVEPKTAAPAVTEEKPRVKKQKPVNYTPNKHLEDPYHKKVEKSFGKQLNKGFEFARGQYQAQFGNVLNTDNARELSQEYRNDRSLSAVVHEPASALIKKFYSILLKEPVPKGKQNMVLFTAGGTGAGKTTGIGEHNVTKKESEKAHIIYDTNMNSFGSAKEKIDKALAFGKKIEIVHTFRDPIDAFKEGAVPRSQRMEAKMGSGRTVPIGTHIATHLGANETIPKLAEHYKDNPNVNIRVIDNSRGRGNSKIVPVGFLQDKKYIAKDLEKELHEHIDKLHGEGKISDKIYRGFKAAGD